MLRLSNIDTKNFKNQRKRYCFMLYVCLFLTPYSASCFLNPLYFLTLFLKLVIRKIGFALIWLGFSVYAFTLAPPTQPDTFDLIVNLSTGKWEGINPLIVALFNLMGVWPMIYACLILIDGVGQKVPAWPFVAASFGVGAFAILPYMALRDRNTTFTPPQSKLLSLLESPWTGRLLLLGALTLLGYGLLNGNLSDNWHDFVYQWKTGQFIHVMSLDFCMLCVIFAPLLADDMAKRNFQNPAIFWTAVLVPLLGILIYLSVRPAMENRTAAVEQA